MVRKSRANSQSTQCVSHKDAAFFFLTQQWHLIFYWERATRNVFIVSQLAKVFTTKEDDLQIFEISPSCVKGEISGKTKCLENLLTFCGETNPKTLK